MEKLKGLIKKCQPFALALVVTAFTAISSFAGSPSGSPSVASTMTTAVGGIKSDFEATVTAVAPVAIGIIAVFMVWKLGMKFFRSITKA